MDADASHLKTLGAGKTDYRYDHPDESILETFPNQHPDRSWVVGLDCAEFTSLCPVTGQPDFGRIRIAYIPGARCVESKSLKLYLGAYRNHPSFHEDCVNRIADDLHAVMAPRFLRVFGDFHPRGGIAIKPVALRWADGLDADARAAVVELLAQHDTVAR
ncbi:MAG TPA: preQ(1) synthase [Acidimicrobiales bacterium]|nr:preQ(1) synthase [Acidimicrobiales bacterium]